MKQVVGFGSWQSCKVLPQLYGQYFMSFLKWASDSDFLWFFKQSKLKMKFHYRNKTYETTPIF